MRRGSQRKMLMSVFSDRVFLRNVKYHFDTNSAATVKVKRFPPSDVTAHVCVSHRDLYRDPASPRTTTSTLNLKITRSITGSSPEDYITEIQHT